MLTWETAYVYDMNPSAVYLKTVFLYSDDDNVSSNNQIDIDAWSSFLTHYKRHMSHVLASFANQHLQLVKTEIKTIKVLGK